MGKDDNNNLVMKGLFIGDDYECFEQAADLSLKVNFSMLDEPLEKVVVYLDPSEFKTIASAELLESGQNWAPLALTDGKLLLRDQSQLMCVKVSE